MESSSVQANVLGRLLVIQQTLDVMSSIEGVSSFLCEALGKIPGIAAAYACMQGTIFPPNDKFVHICDKYVNLSPCDVAHCDIFSAYQLYTLPLRTVRHTYGCLALEVADDKSFEPYHVFIDNIANVVAQSLENRRHIFQLNALNKELENRVQEKTSELLAKESLYRTIFENIHDILFITDAEGKLESINPRFEQQIGCNKTGLDQQSFYEIVHPDDAFIVTDLLEKSASGLMTGGMDMRLRKKCGNYFYADVRACSLSDYGRTKILCIASDITERKQTEQILRAAKEAAEQATQAKTNFLANMSHEIRTPMSAIIGLAQLALSHEQNAKQKDYLSKIYNASQSLLSILNDILDYSKIEAGRLNMEAAPFDLDDVLDHLHTLFGLLAEEKQLSWVFVIEPDVPRQLLGDALRLQQILANLLGNAVKFTEHGEVRLHISLVDRNNSRARLAFSVKDTGIGMTQEQVGQLFQPFMQTDDSISRRFGGTGLGLAISRELLKLMDSDFAVDSELGRGSTFRFELVLGVCAAGAARQPNTADAYPYRHSLLPGGFTLHSQPLAGMRILVAEDNTLNQQVVRELLGLLGCRATVAKDGDAALAILETATFEAVLMDVHMPNMNGIEATKRIRAQSRYRTLPVFALTADAMDEERERCLAAGMNDFLIKPITIETLNSVLRRWLCPRGNPPCPPFAKGGKEETSFLLNKEGSKEYSDFSLNQGGKEYPNPPLQKGGRGDLELDFSHLGQLADNQAFIRQLLQTFLNDFTDADVTLTQYIQAGDFDQARRHVHTLKGAVGNIGGKDLHEACLVLERELKNNSYSPIALNAMLQALADTMAACASIVQGQAATTRCVRRPNTVSLLGTELNALLAVCELPPESLLHSLQAALPNEAQPIHKKLCQRIEAFDFDQARVLLNHIISDFGQATA